jgi:hypothetical protein
MLRRETSYDDFNVVFDNPLRKIDTAREFLLRSIQAYALKKNRQLRVVFFNGDGEETGVSFFFRKNEPDGSTSKRDY